MTTRTIILALFILTGVAASAFAYQGGCPGAGHYQDIMTDLSPDQREKVQKLTDAHHEQLFALQKDIAAKVSEMDALFTVVPPDKASIARLTDEINALQAKRNKLNAEYRVSLTEVTGKPLPRDSKNGQANPCTGRFSGCGATSSGAPGAGASSGVPAPQGS